MKFSSSLQGQINQKVVPVDKGIERKQTFSSKGMVTDYQLSKEYDLIENNSLSFEDWKLQRQQNS